MKESLHFLVRKLQGFLTLFPLEYPHQTGGTLSMIMNIKLSHRTLWETKRNAGFTNLHTASYSFHSWKNKEELVLHTYPLPVLLQQLLRLEEDIK